MLTFEKIKNYYEKGIYSKSMVKNLCLKGYITTDEYKEITGDIYE